MPEHIEIEKGIDIGELSRARKLFRKIRIVEFLIVLFVPVLLMIASLTFILIEPINFLYYFFIFIILLLFLVGLIPRYLNKITDVNLLSRYYLFRIISSITDYIEKPYEKALRNCNFFISTLQFLFFNLNLSNLKNLSFIVKDIGNEKLDYLSALDKEIPRIYEGSSTEQITEVLNGFRQLLYFLKTGDIQSLARSLVIFKKYKMEVDEKIQKQKIWRRKIEEVKIFYNKKSPIFKKVMKFLFILLISVIIVKVLVILFDVQAGGGELIAGIIGLTTLLYVIFLREPSSETFKASK